MTTRRKFAIAALTLGAAAPLAGTPFAETTVSIDIDELARLILRGDDHVDAIELAEWIRDRRSGMRIIDLRPPGQYESGHIPTAERVPIDELSRTSFNAGDTIVLYSEGGAHAGQAWVLLRGLGLTRVFFLRAGMFEWEEQILYPKLARDATDRERAEFARAAALSEYFGGTPERDVPRSQHGASYREMRRRGC